MNLKMKSNKYTTIHTIEPYNFRLVLATPSNKEDLEDLEEKWGIKNENLLANVYDIDHDNWKAVLVVFDFDQCQTITYGMIAHECVHVTDSVFDRIGHTYDYHNNEVGAYLIEQLYTTILKQLKKNKLDLLLTINTEIKPKDKEDI